MKFCVFALLIAGVCVADELRSNKSSKQLGEDAVGEFFRPVLENWKNIIETYLNDLCSNKDSMKIADRLVQLFLNINEDNKAQVFVNTIFASFIRLLADSVIEKGSTSPIGHPDEELPYCPCEPQPPCICNCTCIDDDDDE
ncbi:uncharacterized protein LOC116337039 [Contarinia nasturtii]|uniref:uncharacterized protein LOC116337039 n=1 Tax=Contarinia nasturtii TaxID=265458 RepID=UPI0012D39F72|nr:uncharacterized protein LOC116337039 [Contarinia nasturtii]